MITVLMAGGLAIAGNLLCMTWTDVKGRVFLVDLDQRRVVSHWYFTGADGGYADAAGVAFGADFSLLIADTHNNVVRRFTVFGRPLGLIGRPAEGGPGAARRDRIGWLDRPKDVAVHQDVVYVAGGDGRFRCGVQRFRMDGQSLPPLRAHGDVEGTFGAPCGVWVDDDGVLVADTLQSAIQRFRVSGTYVDTIQLECGDDGHAIAWPMSVLRMPGGDILVLQTGDDPGLKRYRIHDRWLPSRGDWDGRLHNALAFTRDSAGRVYVLDRGGQQVHRLEPDLTYEAVVFDLGETLHGNE